MRRVLDRHVAHDDRLADGVAEAAAGGHAEDPLAVQDALAAMDPRLALQGEDRELAADALFLHLEQGAAAD